ncbi:MinD/ParA family ATP-binding protein [Mycobacterium marinum]|uniref:MinD/ParA family ATP-binding protein n=1 Tax=Mycobacterium marinum TaxID=1781 RepID=UPI00356303F9
MNEREEFLRDRVRPEQPSLPDARQPRQPSGTHRTATDGSRPPVAPTHQLPPAAPRPPTPQPSPVPPRAANPQSPAARPAAPVPHPQPQPAAHEPLPKVPPPSLGAEPTPARTPGEPPSTDHGWRHIIRVASFGLINPRPSAAQRDAAEFEAAIRAPLRGTHKVGVLGKGGVGKTSVAASIGSLLAELRQQDRIVAVDADTAFGRLSSRIDPTARGSFWDLTADRNLASFADVVARLGRNAAGLHVLPGEAAVGGRKLLDPAIYREAALRLDRHFAISIIDCGSTMDAPLTQEVLRDLDALIVVSSPWADGASAAAKTMEWLTDRKLSGLLRRSVVVLNDSDGHSDKRTRSVLAREFVDHGQQVVEVPFDPHLRPGGVIDVSHELEPGTRLKFLQIAATITGHFAARSAADEDPRPTENVASET